MRARIAEDAARHYDQKIAGFFEDALAADKIAWADCPTCRHKVKLTVPDWGSRVRALELLLNQGFGRPSNEPETATTIIVERPLRDLDDERELLAAARHSSGRAALIDAGWTPPATA